MHIAIIQKEDCHYKQLIENVRANWDIVCFDNPEDFLKASIELFDVILIDHDLKETTTKDLISKALSRTKAIFGLMSDGKYNFKEDEINNNDIAVLINKHNVNDIIDWLKYTDARLRIKRYAEREQENYSMTMMAISDDGYVLEQRNGVSVLGISKILTDKSKKNFT